MMGRGHMATTSVLWLACAPPIAAAAGHPMTSGEIIVSTIAIAGWSVWPDWDHSDARLARTLGPISKFFARVVGTLSGGHRVGKTHTLVFAVAMGVLAGALASVPHEFGGVTLPVNWALLVMMWFLAYTMMLTLGLSVFRSRLIGDEIIALEAIGIVALAVWLAPDDWWWMPWTAAVGCLLHCLQDAMTVRGLPNFFWPLPRVRLRFPVLGRAGGSREQIVTSAALAAGLWIAPAVLSGHVWWTAEWLSA
ncbi:metal-dependent hydrolase [Hoyosella sp. YIM 151337]|uniref:metal-dependent hydrolase n=1 Tax=Hoyosella sp. YIM 151337 TaxID=2992742 RepID=UPI00223680B9|nr:metal-dependent hydrolase [Hoyosella sp. YIM 151337]MCW4353053.1 metal-dependent hydrolase [Hoyosella sp. YIM 151337]